MSDATDLPERESMEFDVVIVGAGPAGLSAAIRLKQIDPELSVVVLEKGGEVGAHILSGAVVDPVGIDRLLPDWRDDPDHPFRTPVTEDHFFLLGPSGSLKLPNFLMPPLMGNHGNYIVSLGNVCRWLAAKAEALGVEIYPGFAAAELLFDGDGAVAGVATGDMGVGQERRAGPELPARHGADGQVRADRRGRPRLARQAADAQVRARPQPRAAEIRHRPEGALGGEAGEPPAGPRPAFLRLAARQQTGGGSFLYHFDDNLVAVGFVVHLNYRNPWLSPFEEFQRFKTHPRIAPTFEGGKRISYGARAITEGGWQSVPRLAFPGGALIGCSAGFVNVPRIKGSHNAMLSGILAAEHAGAGARRRPLGRHARRLRGRLARQRDRPRPEARQERQAALVEIRHLRRHRARRPRHVDELARRLLALRHAEARQAGLRRARSGGDAQADRLPEAGRRADLRPSLLRVPVEHQPRGGPAGPSAGRRHVPPEAVRTGGICRPVAALLPGGRL